MARLLSRRAFLVTGAALGGTALVAGVAGAGYLASVDVDGPDPYLDGDRAVLNAFVAIHDDGRVTIQVPRTEMGQGIHTGLAMVVAEELDLPFDGRIAVEHPTDVLPAHSSWANLVGQRPEEASGVVAWAGRRALSAIPFVTTGASASTMTMWHPMRVAGAAARALLVEAAAARLGVPAAELTTADAAVRHEASGRMIPYAELARDAARLEPPAEPALKPRAAWRVMGRMQPRVDLPAKVRGEGVFGADVVQPDMIHATIRQPPVPGSAVARIRNEAAVRAEAGVIDVAVIDGRDVAVLASSWWLAEQAAGRLDVEWTATGADGETGEALAARLRAALDAPGPHLHAEAGEVEAALADGAGAVVEAVYEAPFVTHACMEPMGATVLVRPDGTAEAWVPTQSPTFATQGVRRGAGWAGIDLESVRCHVTMNGGAFGRRSEPDVPAQAAYLAARHPGRPVKLLWSREEDIGRGMLRSHAAGRLRARLGPDGLPAALDATVAAQSLLSSVMARRLPVSPGPDGDTFSVEGIGKGHYAIPAQRVRSVHVPSHLPLALWRANGFGFGTFFTESFVDECARAAGRDPLAYRRALLADSPRHRAVLDRAAAMAGWDGPLPPLPGGLPEGARRGRGLALEAAFESVVAQVAEVLVLPDGELRVTRVCCAADVGVVINPDGVLSQMEGGIVFGLTTALMSRMTVAGGALVETNFHDFPMMRLHNTPAIEVALIDSAEPPGGAGEPGVIPIAAAVANAVADATGRRLRALPLTLVETIGERRTRTVLPPEA